MLTLSSAFSKRLNFSVPDQPTHHACKIGTSKFFLLEPRNFQFLQIFKPSFRGLGSYEFCQSLLSRNFCLVLDLGLSCRLAIFLMGKRILSIVIVLSWKSNFTPRSCILCLPIMRSCIGAWSPGLYPTMSGWRQTFLLAEYSTKKISMSPILSVTKVPLEVPHD